MTERALFAYGHARLHAHRSRRPTEALWRKLEASHSFAYYLETARRTQLAEWVQHLSTEAPVHAVERSLAHDWRLYVQKIASWFPAPWRPAIRAGADLGALPMHAHRLRGAPVPAWANDGGEPDDAWGHPDRLLADWAAQWRTLLPYKPAQQGMDVLETVLVRHLQDLADPKGSATPGLNDRLDRALDKLFRHSPQTPVAVFAYIGLAALDFRRLRGGLIRRNALPGTAD